MTAYGDKLWEPGPERLQAAFMGKFLSTVNKRYGLKLDDYPALHRWSITETADFWQACADFVGVKWMTPPQATWIPPSKGRMRGARWFPGARLNFAANLLPALSDEVVIIAHAEGVPRRELTAIALHREVSRCVQMLQKAGVRPGDRIGGVIANGPEAVIAMLATTALGAVWASCSPDFGAAAVIDRLGQIRPKVVFFTTSYDYAGKHCDCVPVINKALAGLPSVCQAILVSRADDSIADITAKNAVRWDDALASFDGAKPIPFEPMPFDAPLYVMFSSGTTGVPKGIVHGVGGTLLQHKKELLLHSDIGPNSRLLYFTTCGWMMWNWMVSALATGATLVLFDGSVAQPDLSILWRLVAAEAVTALGTSPKFVSACMGSNLGSYGGAAFDPRPLLGRHHLRTILSTGAPLMPEQFQWLYEHAGPDVHLASISGGTDIISCFMLGTPLLPVRAGEIQYAGLGMAIDSWDECGRSLRGQKGELVCTRPFPSMPIGFWNDDDGVKYGKAYFSHYSASGDEVWRHGDYVEITPSGGVVVYGRSDATLNPGGVRIGTAEIYRQVESLPEVQDSIAVGKKDGHGDESIVLFVKLQTGIKLDLNLMQKIRAAIRSNLTPRHVPQAIVQVADIPYTRSGKKVELAVAQAIHGHPVSNLSALMNPEAITEYTAYSQTSEIFKQPSLKP